MRTNKSVSFLILCTFLLVNCNLIQDIINEHGVAVDSFIFWPNATIPFYINPDHFDHEQSLTIMTALSMFSFKTCLKFAPVMSPPADSQHVLVFMNPEGRRRCDMNNDGHSVFMPHAVVLGYECLRSPYIDMMLMRALGFPFEHNKENRDLYVDILMENIEQDGVQFFTKENQLPLELRVLPYDVNSVMHFGTRDYSKNGHRTIIFKDHKVQQNRVSLTETDLRKIEIVYGPECLKRDRQEKIELCQSYPGAARKKRNIPSEHKSLRVNPEITAPPYMITAKINDSLKDLGIRNEIQEIIESVYKVSSSALKNARVKYCNDTKANLRTDISKSLNESSDVLGILEVIADYAKSVVDHALSNLTIFCQASDNIDSYLRSRCPYDDGSGRCRQTYRSTKSGLVKYSTQHRPTYYQSTKLPRTMNQFVHFGRAGEGVNINQSKHTNDTAVSNTADHDKDAESKIDRLSQPRVRRKRHLVKDSVVSNLENSRKRRTNRDILRPKIIRKRDVEAISVKQNNTVNSNINEGNTSNDLSKLRTNSSAIGNQDVNIVRRDLQKHSYRMKKKKHEKRGRSKPNEPKRSKTYAPKTVRLLKANKEFYDERKWPTGVVVYAIKNEKNYDIDNMRERLEEVNSILKERTCVKLQEISEDEGKNYKDYLLIDSSPDYVTGRVGGKQIFGSVELFQGDQHRQHAAMMVMAMLGFYFEVSRHDRDRHIRVHNRHIRPDKLHHFEKIREDSTLPLPYDYRSATHPAWQFWRTIGKTGISTVATFKEQDPDGSVMRSLGQNEELLSDIDIIKINSVYGVNCFKRIGERSKTNERNGRNGKKPLEH